MPGRAQRTLRTAAIRCPRPSDNIELDAASLAVLEADAARPSTREVTDRPGPRPRNRREKQDVSATAPLACRSRRRV